MRSLMLAASLLILASPAWARCECACVGGQMRAVCPPTDLVAPICQGICDPVIQSNRLVVPLAGGAQSVEPNDPADLTSRTGQGSAAGLGRQF